MSLIRRLLQDGISAALLGLGGFVLFVRHAPNLAMTHDAYLKSFLHDIGVLGLFNWSPSIKMSGRPFVGAGWTLAAELSGGSVLGYNVFHLICYSLTAVLFYALLRLLGVRRGLALIAAGLKLTWTFNQQAPANHSLAIYFAECLTLLAACGFTLWACGRHTVGRLGFGLGTIVCGASLVVAVGTYTTLWPLVGAFPILAWGFLRPVSPRRFGVVTGSWYTLAGLSGAVCLAHIATLRVLPGKAGAVTLSAVAGNVAEGVKAVFIDSFLLPFAFVRDQFEAGPLAVAGILALAFTLPWMIGTRLGSRLPDGGAAPNGRAAIEKGSGPRHRHVVLLLSGVLLGIGALVPPSVIYAAEYGTRFGHCAVYGWIAVVLSLLLILESWHKRLATIVATAGMYVLLFNGSFFWLVHMHGRYPSAGWRTIEDLRVIEHFSGIEEGTVIVGEGMNRGRSEELLSWTTRLFSDTRETFFLTDVLESRPRSEKVAVQTRLDLRTSRSSGGKPNVFILGRVPFRSKEPKPVRALVDEDRLIVFRFDRVFLDFLVDKSRSNLERLGTSRVDGYHSKLYPNHRDWQGGGFVDARRYAVVATSETGRPFGSYVWFPPQAVVAVAPSACRSDEKGERKLLKTGRRCPLSVRIPEAEAVRLEFSLAEPCRGAISVFVQGELLEQITCRQDLRSYRTLPVTESRTDWAFASSEGEISMSELVPLLSDADRDGALREFDT